MNDLYSEEHINLYQKLLTDVRGMDSATAYQFCCYGKDYIVSPDKRFMVVGRVMNGWFSIISNSIESEMLAAADPSILKFIDNEVSRSPFWRVTRDVVQGLGMDGVDNWYDNLA